MYTELYSTYGKCVKVPYEFKLRQYPNSFILVNCKNNEREECADDVEEYYVYFKSNNFVATYYDPINKNTLYLKEFRFEFEECDDIDKVINATSNHAYDYLMKELCNNKGISVFWSQIYGTASDYTIVYDQFGEDFLYDKSYLDELLKKHNGYKYNYIKYGCIHKITEEMME